jgi:CRISPR-associated protein Cas1
MATLYLTQQGATLRKEQNRLVVEYEDRVLADVQDFKVERVVVFGNVQLTSQAIAFLLDRGIDTAFLSMRGRLKGRLAPLESKNSLLRLHQYERTRETRFTLALAQTIVAGKIANCRELLARHQRNHPECDLSMETTGLAALGKKVAHQNELEKLRGIEGQAASVYFDGFAKMLRRGEPFNKRSRRPPADPVNSMLSFGYALLYNEAVAALVSVGFDAYLGFYHQPRYGRVSLALDLMEEMRQLVVDRLVLSLINREVFKAADFQKGDDGGVYLNEEGRKRFLREYERSVSTEFVSRQGGARTSFRRAIYEQALALQRTVMQGAAYQPFQGWH